MRDNFSPTRDGVATWVRRGAGHGHDRHEGLEVISFGESAVADEGAGDAGEGEEMFGLAFVA
ncbi:hypothetical protein ACH4XT_39955, partial [Streptomyces avidinii]|uniref:hypothetical protein n=1 Tax=Streptomyces avidinii TaxID=1895 RepID=UPI00378C0590